MTPIKIDSATKGCNKRWDRVSRVFGDSILATRTDRKDNTIQLFVLENGHVRHLYTNDAKVVDYVDNNGLKRTYVYRRKGECIEGQMVTDKNMPEAIKPLVVGAKWITRDLIPRVVELTINPLHRDSSLYIKAVENEVNCSTLEHIAKVKAENFETRPKLLPKKMTFETVSGEIITTEDSGMDNLQYANYFGLTKEPLGQNLMVVV